MYHLSKRNFLFPPSFGALEKPVLPLDPHALCLFHTGDLASVWVTLVLGLSVYGMSRLLCPEL